MAIAAETLSGNPRVGVALEAKGAIVVVPGTVTLELSATAYMNPRIGPTKAVAVAMAAGTRAGRVGIVMARGTVLDIMAGWKTMAIDPLDP